MAWDMSFFHHRGRVAGPLMCRRGSLCFTATICSLDDDRLVSPVHQYGVTWLPPRQRGGGVCSALLLLYTKEPIPGSVTKSLGPLAPEFQGGCARTSGGPGYIWACVARVQAARLQCVFTCVAERTSISVFSVLVVSMGEIAGACAPTATKIALRPLRSSCRFLHQISLLLGRAQSELGVDSGVGREDHAARGRNAD